MTEYLSIIRDGLWKNNPGLVQLLGLCPSLAVTTNCINGLSLGVATICVLVSSNITVSFIRYLVPNEVRLPVFMLVIASFVTVVEILIKAFYYELYLILGIFIPLIVTNCIVIGRAEAYAAKNPPLKSALDSLMMGLGITLTMTLLGGLREIIGQGTLFAQAELLFGTTAQGMTITVIEHYRGFLLVVLPPGAFFGLALLIALKKVLDKRFVHQ